MTPSKEDLLELARSLKQHDELSDSLFRNPFHAFKTDYKKLKEKNKKKMSLISIAISQLEDGIPTWIERDPNPTNPIKQEIIQSLDIIKVS